MIPPIAKAVYEARRSLKPATQTEKDGTVTQLDRGLPFDELGNDEREALYAEAQAYLQSGEPMQDALGQAIVDALK